jgi:predicted Rossmann-fold nucleotide-binding protein
MLERIISGCQTGADEGGLAAAKQLGLKTGGWMPAGYRTEIGSRKDLHDLYGLKCSSMGNYWHRTQLNVRDSDATIIFGSPDSSGSKLTIKYCKSMSKPYMTISGSKEPVEEVLCEIIREFITTNKVVTLNVAGNRESVNPGIFKFVKETLVSTLGE